MNVMKISGIAVILMLLISSIIVFVRSSSSQDTVPIKKQGTETQDTTPSKKQSKVKISNDGIQFPKPSTTERYISEKVSCKKLDKLEPSAFEDGSINGFSDYDSYEAHRLVHSCDLIGLTDENQRAIGYFLHEGDYKDKAFDKETGRCKFTGEDKPYSCVYKEVKDGEFITSFKNNEGKRLEVVFYNDYKAGKLDKWFEEIEMGTKRKFILNDEGKLEFSLNDPVKKVKGSFLLKPGNNYPVEFMLLGTAIAMVDNNIPMSEDGIDIRFTSLKEDEMKKNYKNELSKIVAEAASKAKNKPIVFKKTDNTSVPPPPPPPPPKGPKPGMLPRPPQNKDGEKSLNELTDEEYIKYNEAWRHKNFGGTYDKDDHPDRFKRRFQQQKIDFLKKPNIFYFLPGHSRSYKFDLKNNRSWKGYKDETGDVDESRIIRWLDTEYENKSRGRICPNPSNPRDSKTCFFPNHTRTIKEINELRNTNATAITNDLNQKLQAKREHAYVNRR